MTSCASTYPVEFQLVGVVAPSILELEILLKALGTTSDILPKKYYITYDSHTRNFTASVDVPSSLINKCYYITAPVGKNLTKNTSKPSNHRKRWSNKEHADFDAMFTNKSITIELIQEAAVKHSRTFVSIQSKLFEKKYITFKESVDISAKNSSNRQLAI